MKKIAEETNSFLGVPDSELKAGRIVQCPHCNGYGSSFKDAEGVNKCTFCGGGGVVPDQIAKQYQELFANQTKWNKGLHRYYLVRSSIFDNPSVIYNIGEFGVSIEKAGGYDIKIENAEGWSNQPEVVTFLADEAKLPAIKKSLDSLDVFKKWGCILRKKDWETLT